MRSAENKQEKTSDHKAKPLYSSIFQGQTANMRWQEHLNRQEECGFFIFQTSVKIEESIVDCLKRSEMRNFGDSRQCQRRIHRTDQEN